MAFYGRAVVLRNGSARGRPLPQVLEPQQHSQHTFELVIEVDLVTTEPLQLVGVERFAQRLFARQRTAIRARKAHRISDGIHLGDVVEESDGDLMGDGVNIAARLEGLALPGAVCLSEDPYRQVRSRLNFEIRDLGEKQLKNIAEPVRVQPDLGPADFLRKGVAQPYGSVQH
jgi:hypothetical protein